MLDDLVKRARRKGLDAIIEPRICTQDDLNLEDLASGVGLAAAFNVIHESAYPDRFLRQCGDTLRPGGRLLIAEPRGHVSSDEFAETIAIARPLGLAELPAPRVWRSRTALLVKEP